MDVEPVVRSVCYFTSSPDARTAHRLDQMCARLESEGIAVQTRRILAPASMSEFAGLAQRDDIYPSVGRVSLASFESQRELFAAIPKMSCHLDLTDEEPRPEHVDALFWLLRECPEKTFYFSYSFLTPPSSPYFPASVYAQDGFSIGLQPTNLAADCDTPEAWFGNMRGAWERIALLVGREPDFIGIDSSVAPLGSDAGSLVDFVVRLYGSFQRSILTDFYLWLTAFLKAANPAPAGLCGLMLPCLEDTTLAQEYEAGRFDLPTNLLLSLNSGLGIDTYPIGIDESPDTVLDLLRLVRGLSLKHAKTLSVRFVSDGRAAVGDMTDFRNEYLSDVTVRSLLPER